MSIRQAASSDIALRHPIAALRFYTGHKHELHKAIILESAKYLFGTRFIKHKWLHALKEIENGILIPPVKVAGKENAGNNLNTTFGKWIYCCVRALQPQYMIETGVAHGASSLIILNAMNLNGKGHLFSIDLPGMDTNSAYNFNQQTATGWMVPESLRSRWELHLGDAKTLLPELLQKAGAIDIFFHDSDHSYDHMKFEFETVRPFVTESGIILSDDVHKNESFKDFTDTYNLKALQFNKGGCAVMN